MAVAGTFSGGQVSTSGGSDLGQTFPTAETITRITVYITPTSGTSLLTPVTVTAQLYTASPPSDTFSAVPGAIASVTLVGTVVIGSSFHSLTTGLSIPVTAESRGIIVLSASSVGASVAQSLSVNASSSLTAQ
jgi:BclB C-terminal domain-containing protein